MKRESWVVVANQAIARFFKIEKGVRLVEEECLTHPEGRLHEGDLIADKPGTTHEGYPMGQPHSPKKIEATAFAKTIGQKIETLRTQNSLDRLYIAAAPSFLGLIRQHMSPQSSQLLHSEIDKDITNLKPEAIKEYFPIGL